MDENLKKTFIYGIAWLITFAFVISFPFFARTIFTYNSLEYNVSSIAFFAAFGVLFVLAIQLIKQKTTLGRTIGAIAFVLNLLKFTYIFILGGFAFF